MANCPHDGGTRRERIGDSIYVKCVKCGDVISVEDAPGQTKRGNPRR